MATDYKPPEELSVAVNEAKKRVNIGGRYRHYKGKEYLVRDVVLHSETLELLVLYEPQYESGAKLWVRPFELFVGEVKVDGKKILRFNPI